MKPHPLPPVGDLLRLFSYDPLTGEHIRKIRTSSKSLEGSVAGSLHNTGYRYISIRGRRYAAHRLAFKMIHGSDPPADLDHVNGIKDDNRIANLRPATRAENIQNTPRRSTNTSGHKGVSWHKPLAKWRSQITIRGRVTHLGYFEELEEADAAARTKRDEIHGDFARHE